MTAQVAAAPKTCFEQVPEALCDLSLRFNRGAGDLNESKID